MLFNELNMICKMLDNKKYAPLFIVQEYQRVPDISCNEAELETLLLQIQDIIESKSSLIKDNEHEIILNHGCSK